MLAISVGGVVFGIIGAVVAVPLVAVVNTVATYLSSRWGNGSAAAPSEEPTDASPAGRPADAPAPVGSPGQE